MVALFLNWGPRSGRVTVVAESAEHCGCKWKCVGWRVHFHALRVTAAKFLSGHRELKAAVMGLSLIGF